MSQAPEPGEHDPVVSVIVASYNCALFVERAIHSALDQEGVRVEIIAVNDRSTDDTLAVLKSLAAIDARLRVIDSAVNLGPAGARNLALENTRGQWAAILDADDVLPANALRKLIAFAEVEKADIIAGNLRTFNFKTKTESEARFTLFPPVQLLDLRAFLNGARPFSDELDFGLLKPLFRMSFLKQAKVCYRSSIRHGEDFHFIVDALLAGARYIFARNIDGYVYTTRDSGLSRTKVDYSKMIRLTAELQLVEAIRKSSDLVQVLERRADALRKLELDRMVDSASGGKDRSLIVLRALSSASGRRWIKAKLLNRRGR